MGLIWWIVGIVAAISIVGIPYVRSCFVIAKFSFFPFGKEAIGRNELTEQQNAGTGVFGFMGNVVWFFIFGVWLALGHLVFALLNFVTIIGIPFGMQHLKLAGLTLAPIGQTIVTKELAQAARTYNANEQLLKNRGLPFAKKKIRLCDNSERATSLLCEDSGQSKTIHLNGLEGHGARYDSLSDSSTNPTHVPGHICRSGRDARESRELSIKFLSSLAFVFVASLVIATLGKVILLLMNRLLS